MRYPNFASKKHHLIIASAFIFLFGFLVFLKSSQSTNSNVLAVSSTTKNHSKKREKLRPITKRGHKRACSLPTPGRVACNALVSTNTEGQPLTGNSPANTAYGPAQFHTAYQLPCTPGGSVASVCSTPSSFGPETIAIVDAGNFSTGVSGLVSSLQAYDTNFGIPACSITNGCLDVVNESGQTSPLPSSISGWDDEIALDVETAHMMCQTCVILLAEASSTYSNDLSAAEATAATFNPVSMSDSWMGDDDSAYDSDFNYHNIAVVAATGDNGSETNGEAWPADNPDVTAASGTTLQLNSNNTWASETVWSGSGGGCSTDYSAPLWQTSLADWNTNGCGTGRSYGDMSADGDPDTGEAIDVNSTWLQVGGTSLATPLLASMYALAGGEATSTYPVSVPYSLFSGSNSHDITSGNDCVSGETSHCTATTGFDTPTGLGSPNGLAGFIEATVLPASGLTSNNVSQNQIVLTWTASNSVSVSGYHIYKNGSLLTSVSGTNYTVTGLTANTPYSFYVVAYNSLNQTSTDSNTYSTTTYYPEDMNHDDHINLLDLSLFASQYGESGPNLSADFNHDGTVNILDLSLLAEYYNAE